MSSGWGGEVSWFWVIQKKLPIGRLLESGVTGTWFTW